jgi:hypothetical protein
MPTLAQTVLSALSERTPTPPWPSRLDEDLLLNVERPIEAIGPLVAKIANADIERLARRFGTR